MVSSWNERQRAAQRTSAPGGGWTDVRPRKPATAAVPSLPFVLSVSQILSPCCVVAVQRVLCWWTIAWHGTSTKLWQSDSPTAHASLVTRGSIHPSPRSNCSHKHDAITFAVNYHSYYYDSYSCFSSERTRMSPKNDSASKNESTVAVPWRGRLNCVPKRHVTQKDNK